MKIYGGEILIIGDLHISDVFNGRHKSYLENCFYCLGKLNEIVEERKPKAIVLLGDIVGWVETNIRNREVLGMFCKILKSWTRGGDCPIFVVKGNHDIKGYPEFLFLSEIGLITTSSACNGYFDYYSEDGSSHEVRFHIVDYKEEDRPLNYAEDGVSNIVLGHNNYTIQGVTTWYAEHDGIELSMLQNFGNVDMVISGHIHNPSPEIYYTSMSSGNHCGLLYCGCPTRPIKDKNMYDYCWVGSIKYNTTDKSTDIETIRLELKPASEIFYEDDSFIEEKSEEALEEEIRKENLKGVLDDLLKYRMSQADPMAQIDVIPNATDSAKEVAKSYLLQALNIKGGKL